MALELTERGIGLELIQMEIGKALFDELNTEIDYHQEKWQERDLEWQILTGSGSSGVIVEYIDDKNFHLGHRPSLILNDAPREAYPNVSVMAYEGRPTGNIVDQGTNFSVQPVIELMTKSDDSELEVDRRTHRTVEAVHQVLVRNERLGGKSLGWTNDPSIVFTDIFTRNENVSHGETFFWQAARITYTLDRHTILAQ